MFPRNVGEILSEYTALHPSRYVLSLVRGTARNKSLKFIYQFVLKCFRFCVLVRSRKQTHLGNVSLITDFHKHPVGWKVPKLEKERSWRWVRDESKETRFQTKGWLEGAGVGKNNHWNTPNGGKIISTYSLKISQHIYIEQKNLKRKREPIQILARVD
jgi:hypothetical protein